LLVSVRSVRVRLKNTIIAIAGFMLVSALAYGELVLDWRTLHAEHQMKFALTSSAGFLMADYEQLKAEMKRKYGDRVGVSVPVTGYPAAQNGVAEVSLDGKVLENRSLRKLSDVYGLFIVDPDRAEPIRFPFRIAPDQNLANLDRSLVKTLTDHFKRVPQAWFEFSDTDWTIDQCFSVKSGLGLGVIGDLLRLEEGTSCIVRWNGKRPGSIIVFVGRADGKAWLRPFSARLCRSITETEIQRLDPETAKGLDYAACLLGDQTTNAGHGTSLFGATYGFRQDRRLQQLAGIGKD
jgi:hypothetical protein